MGALEGRVCAITGAGRGIGREHALLFASEGAKLVINDLGGASDGTGERPVPRVSKTIVRKRAAKTGTWLRHAHEPWPSPWIRRSGSPSPCSSTCKFPRDMVRT